MRHHRKRLKGVTLVEVMMVLGIMSLILGMMMQFYSISHNSMKSSEMAQEAITIMNTVSGFRDGGNNILAMTTINERVLAESGLMPGKYVPSKKDGLIDPWGVPLQVFVDGNSVAINFNWVNKQSCIHLASTDFGAGVSIQIGASSLLSNPISASDISKYCAAGNGYLEIYQQQV